MKTRPATSTDLEAIMVIERESFGEDVGEGGMASQKLMRSRIEKCNSVTPPWFWVAQSKTRVEGYLVLQPCTLDPDECMSWDHATDGGTFERTFHHEGDSVFGVSLGVRSSAPAGTFYALVHRGVLLMAQTAKKKLMLCSRLPALAKTRDKKSVAPEDYWKLIDKRGAPVDPLLNMFHGAFGVGAYKFMPNGYAVDAASGGHAALILVTDPYLSLELLAERIYAAGVADGQRKGGGNE